MIRLIGQLGLDGSGWQTGLNRAESAAGRFSRGVALSIGPRLAAAFSVGAIVGFTKKVIAYADTIEETSTRLGVSTKALQEWTYAANQSGVSAEKLTAFMERLANAAADPKNLALFASMGINPEGMTNEGLFRSVSGWARGRDVNEVRAKLSEFLDFRTVGPILNLLRSDLDAAAQSARDMGAVMDDQTVSALAKLNNQLASVGQVLMANFAPALIEAGKLAIRASARVGGAAGWWGGMTANINARNIGDLIKASAIGPLGLPAVMRIIKTMSPDETMTKAADAYLSGQLKAAEESLSKMLNVTPGQPPRITVRAGKDTVADLSRSAESVRSDALVGIGNFLGASGRGAIEAIQRKQVQLLAKIEQNTRPNDSGAIEVP